MSKLFEKTSINGMELSNRFVRSATWEGLATDSSEVTQSLINTVSALAAGGVGLIITGHSFVQPDGQASPKQVGIYDDKFINGVKEMADSVHAHKGKIVMQLAHAGNFAVEQITGTPPLVASDYKGLAKTPRKEMTIEDIKQLVNSFADAASRAKKAGYDGVQIHSAHGYLLSQFLSPAFNRRNDEYGGSIEKRSRIHIETYKAIRKAVGDNFPILIKMNGQDYAENGLTIEDSVFLAHALAEAGIDAIELSGGLLTGGKLSPSRLGIKSQDKEAYFKEDAKAFKKEIDIPLILVGGIRSFEVSEQLLSDGIADYISMSRPLIREPNLINTWKEGDRSRARCKSDNMCFGPAMEGKGISCVTAQIEEEKLNKAE